MSNHEVLLNAITVAIDCLYERLNPVEQIFGSTSLPLNGAAERGFLRVIERLRYDGESAYAWLPSSYDKMPTRFETIVRHQHRTG
jgi:hypothetical protein